MEWGGWVVVEEKRKLIFNSVEVVVELGYTSETLHLTYMKI